jgi:hypothetical protein
MQAARGDKEALVVEVDNSKLFLQLYSNLHFFVLIYDYPQIDLMACNFKLKRMTYQISCLIGEMSLLLCMKTTRVDLFQ